MFELKRYHQFSWGQDNKTNNSEKVLELIMAFLESHSLIDSSIRNAIIRSHWPKQDMLTTLTNLDMAGLLDRDTLVSLLTFEGSAPDLSEIINLLTLRKIFVRTTWDLLIQCRRSVREIRILLVGVNINQIFDADRMNLLLECLVPLETINDNLERLMLSSVLTWEQCMQIIGMCCGVRDAWEQIFHLNSNGQFDFSGQETLLLINKRVAKVSRILILSIVYQALDDMYLQGFINLPTLVEKLFAVTKTLKAHWDITGYDVRRLKQMDLAILSRADEERVSVNALRMLNLIVAILSNLNTECFEVCVTLSQRDLLNFSVIDCMKSEKQNYKSIKIVFEAGLLTSDNLDDMIRFLGSDKQMYEMLHGLYFNKQLTKNNLESIMSHGDSSPHIVSAIALLTKLFKVTNADIDAVLKSSLSANPVNFTKALTNLSHNSLLTDRNRQAILERAPYAQSLAACLVLVAKAGGISVYDPTKLISLPGDYQDVEEAFGILSKSDLLYRININTLLDNRAHACAIASVFVELYKINQLNQLNREIVLNNLDKVNYMVTAKDALRKNGIPTDTNFSTLYYCFVNSSADEKTMQSYLASLSACTTQSEFNQWVIKRLFDSAFLPLLQSTSQYHPDDPAKRFADLNEEASAYLCLEIFQHLLCDILGRRLETAESQLLSQKLEHQLCFFQSQIPATSSYDPSEPSQLALAQRL